MDDRERRFERLRFIITIPDISTLESFFKSRTMGMGIGISKDKFEKGRAKNVRLPVWSTAARMEKSAQALWSLTMFHIKTHPLFTWNNFINTRNETITSGRIGK
ncbi:hypothetical protein ACMFMG_000313 [Clarireedia jacksonii]